MSLQLFLIYTIAAVAQESEIVQENEKYLTPPDEDLNCWHSKQNHKMAADNKWDEVE